MNLPNLASTFLILADKGLGSRIPGSHFFRLCVQGVFGPSKANGFLTFVCSHLTEGARLKVTDGQKGWMVSKAKSSKSLKSSPSYDYRPDNKSRKHDAGKLALPPVWNPLQCNDTTPLNRNTIKLHQPQSFSPWTHLCEGGKKIGYSTPEHCF